MQTRLSRFKVHSTLLAFGAALSFIGCQGPAGPAGAPGEVGDVGAAGGAGAAGTTGTKGVSCSVSSAAGVKTLSCEDGTTATVTDGVPGVSGVTGTSCTLVDNGNGTKTISCTDGTSTTVFDGAASFNLNVEVPKTLEFTDIHATVGTDNKPVVEFRVIDKPAGRGAVGLKNDGSAASNMRFTWAKFVPGTAGNPDNWRSMLSTAAPNLYGTSERNGTLKDLGNGYYTYTFAISPTLVVLPYEPAATYRVGLQMSGSVNGRALPPTNGTHDFVPDGVTAMEEREVVATASCNECHGTLKAHGSRVDTKYCVTCHNPGTKYLGTQTVDFAAMVHGIHSAHMRSTLGTPGQYDYTVGASHNFSEVTYPQALNNCLKCHNGNDSATPQGDSWSLTPTKEACTGCHASVVFDGAPGNHSLQSSNMNCALSGCHDADPSNYLSIPAAHATEDPTPNTPQSLPESAIITYDIRSVTMVGAGGITGPLGPTAAAGIVFPKIEFKITVAVNGVSGPLDLSVLKAGTGPVGPTSYLGNAPYYLTGGPSFLLAYAQSQDGITVPADWNNLGRASAQPLSVTLASILAGTGGSVPVATSGGYYTTTLSGSNAFPDSTGPNGLVYMRTVSLQGYFSQANYYADPKFTGTCANPALCNLARHVPSVEKTVAGDTDRRSIVDSAKCGNCHEWFLGHGGNRVYNTDVCIMCHVPNLTSSGRGAAPGTLATRLALAGADTAQMIEKGYGTTDALLFPEEPQSFKGLIHGAHSSAKRALAGGQDFDFVRDRGTSGVFYYNFGEITFPGILSNCETCHKPGTYDVALPPGVMMTTVAVSGLGFVGPTGSPTSCADGTVVEASTDNVVAARGGNCLPNDTDTVTTAVTSTCNGCHTSPMAELHFVQHGASLRVPRSTAVSNMGSGQVETCELCHGTGRLADVAFVHAP